MACSKNEDIDSKGGVEGWDRETDASDVCGSDSGFSDLCDADSENRIIVSREAGLFETLRNVLRGEEDDNMSNRYGDEENGILQWLRALDLRVVGACRVDERLTPLGVAEDQLLVQLSQHFEASEVGMLVGCLCTPLVSIRVGKVVKQGTLLCPIGRRGYLNLTLMPSSDLGVSFLGDDGCTERLSVLGTVSESSEVIIEQISADSSGRSFLIKHPDGGVSYFWCSEKSKHIGDELLTKMKDLLSRKPSLAELTGISESRLNCFAIHLHAYLLRSTSVTPSEATVLPTSSHMMESDLSESDPGTLASFPFSKHSSFLVTSSHMGRLSSSLYQNSLAPKSSTFNECFPRNSLSVGSGVWEKLRQRGDGYCDSMDAEFLPVASISGSNTTQTPYSSQTENDRCAKHDRYCNFLPLTLPETLHRAPPPSSTPHSCHLVLPEVPALSSSIFSPYYGWCPPCAPALQCTMKPRLPLKTTEPASPPLPSSLFSAGESSISRVLPIPPLVLADIPSLDFPSFLPDPLVHFPLPASSLFTMPGMQQMPTFTPLMSDPIVHIPVIDVCSSSQGYLVSAGQAIPTTISAPLPKLVNSGIPDAELAAEETALETLRLLISSTQSNLPAVWASADNNVSDIHGKKFNALVSDSGSLHSVAEVIGDLNNNISAVGLDLLPQRSISGKCDGINIRAKGGSCNLADGGDDLPSHEAEGAS